MITRSEIRLQLEQRLTGALSDAALAAWAFDRFYALEIGDEAADPADADLIDDLLDQLMFADDADFALSEAELRHLLERLGAS